MGCFKEGRRRTDSVQGLLFYFCVNVMAGRPERAAPEAFSIDRGTQLKLCELSFILRLCVFI